MVSLALGANREGKGRVKGKASRTRSSRRGSAPVCVRRNAQHRELKLPESTRFVLNTVLMVSLFTRGPTGASPPPLSFQNIQSREKSFTSPRARGEAPTMSSVLSTNPEGKERVRPCLKAVVNTVGGLMVSRRVFCSLRLFFFCSYSTNLY